MTRQLTAKSAPPDLQGQHSWQMAIRSWPDDLAQAWTINTVEGAAQCAAIEAVVATGSAVRDVQHSDDLDLVVVYRVQRPELPRPPISIDLRQYEQADVLQKLAAGHDYLTWTVRYGRALFERDCWWTQLQADRANQLLLPSVEESRERAQKAERLYKELSAVGDTCAASELHLSMLTHLSRAALSSAGVFPRSRPELAGQLRTIGESDLADRLACALRERNSLAHTY